MRGHEAPLAGGLADLPSTLQTAIISSPTPSSSVSPELISENIKDLLLSVSSQIDNDRSMSPSGDSSGSTGKGILIGILSAFGSAAVAVIILGIFFFFRYTQRGRIILDRIGRPGEYDDEQAFAREEEEALESMDDISRSEYLRAKGELLP